MGEPNVLVSVAIVAFTASVAACFALLDARRAVLATLFAGWLFLPHFSGHFDLVVLSSKTVFIPAAVLAASIVFDWNRWRGVRPVLLDAPVLVLCLGAAGSALSNGLGAKEAISSTFEATMTWGAPYVLGRAYLGHPRAVRDLAKALVLAALAYVPLCLWEIRMSPQLQYTIYGFRSENFTTIIRFGGFRPTVFMQAGLAVAMFMALATLTAYWLWRTNAWQRVSGIPTAWLCAVLALTTLLCKSTGAVLLLAAGVATLELTRKLRTGALLVALAIAPGAYYTARIAGWHGDPVVSIAADVVNADRAESLRFRFGNERLLVQKAMVRPWLGWGRFGRSFVYDDEGRSVVIVDSLWIITLGFAGLVGLAGIAGVLALPSLALLRTFPARHWSDPRVAPAGALGLALLLWAVDNLVNAMLAPIYPVIAGALVSLAVFVRRTRLPARVRARIRAPAVAQDHGTSVAVSR